jgi:transcriptional regulator with XRE-family HTH domain
MPQTSSRTPPDAVSTGRQRVAAQARPAPVAADNELPAAPAPSVDEHIAARLRALRQQRGLSLAALAQASGVSKAMISRIERAGSSATASLLGRLAAGLGVSLTELLVDVEGDGVVDPASARLRRRAEQPQWRDPALGYLRRQVAPRDAQGVELVEVQLPRAARISYPPWAGVPYAQRLWLLDGELQVDHGDERARLAAGDCLSFAVDRPLQFKALGGRGCRYLLVISPGPLTSTSPAPAAR